MIAVVERRGKVSEATRHGLREALTHAGLEPASWIKVSKARKATAAVAEMIRGSADTVVVCGGDGTVRAAAEALVDTEVTLAVVPTGTANLFAAGLDLPAEPAAVVELVTSGHRLVLVFFDGMATCVLVGNLGNLPGGLHAFPGASAIDGLLNAAVTTAAGLRQWAIADHQHRPRASGSVAARPVRPGQANRREDEPRATVRDGRRDQRHQ